MEDCTLLDDGDCDCDKCRAVKDIFEQIKLATDENGVCDLSKAGHVNDRWRGYAMLRHVDEIKAAMEKIGDNKCHDA